MKVTVSGATGLLGRRIVAALRERGDDVTVLSRDPQGASAALGVRAEHWLPESGPAPAEALSDRDGVIHLAGESVAQRWSEAAKRRIRSSRVLGTGDLVAGLRAASPRPSVLVCASASGYYGPRGDEPVDESEPGGDDFLAAVCRSWESEAVEAEALDMRVARLRTGLVLDRAGGALSRMLVPFKLGVGGPVAGGSHYMPWIHAADVAGMYLAALDRERWSGPINVSAPEPVTNREFSKALGSALHRPAVLPVPSLALRLLYGEMSEIVLTGVRMVPVRAQALGYRFRYRELDEALEAALAG
jgi:uncharacterized protein (TIGR01777 family)